MYFMVVPYYNLIIVGLFAFSMCITESQNNAALWAMFIWRMFYLFVCLLLSLLFAMFLWTIGTKNLT